MQKIKKNKLEILFNVILLIATLSLMFLLIEIFLRTFYPQDLNYLKLDSSLRYVGIPGMKTTFRTSEFNTLIKLNSKGLRDKEHDYKNPEEKYRILILGDSMTFGYGVESQETYAKVLERMLNSGEEKYEVINAGITAYTTAQELAYLEKEGLKYKPDLVILGFMSNDITDNYFDEGIFSFENGELIRTSYDFSLWQKLKNFLSSHSHFAKLIKKKMPDKMSEEKKAEVMLSIKAIAGIPEPVIDKGWEKTFLLIKKMKEELDKEGIDFLVVILPTKQQIDNKELEEMIKEYALESSSVNINRTQIILSEYLEKEDFTSINMLDEFRKANVDNDFSFEIDGHFNKKGHELAAKLIYEKIKSGFLRPQK